MPAHICPINQLGLEIYRQYICPTRCVRSSVYRHHRIARRLVRLWRRAWSRDCSSYSATSLPLGPADSQCSCPAHSAWPLLRSLWDYKPIPVPKTPANCLLGGWGVGPPASGGERIWANFLDELRHSQLLFSNCSQLKWFNYIPDKLLACEISQFAAAVEPWGNIVQYRNRSYLRRQLDYTFFPPPRIFLRSREPWKTRPHGPLAFDMSVHLLSATES